MQNITYIKLRFTVYSTVSASTCRGDCWYPQGGAIALIVIVKT